MQYHDKRSRHTTQACEEWDLGSGSFSTPFMTRNKDISFGTGSPISCDVGSPTFTCRTSFSSFIVEPSTPSPSSGFSFCSLPDSNAFEFSSPVSSMSSFSFFTPNSVEQGSSMVGQSTNIAGVDVTQEGNLLSYCLGPDNFGILGESIATEVEFCIPPNVSKGPRNK